MTRRRPAGSLVFLAAWLLLLAAASAGCGEGGEALAPGEEPGAVYEPFDGVTVEFIARDGATGDELDPSAWSVRVVSPEGLIESGDPASRSRVTEDGRVVAGPLPPGMYDVYWEAEGYRPLTRTLTFRPGVDNRIDAALDPVAGE